MSIGERLKELRAKSGETQKTVGMSIGVNEVSYRKYELGINEPSAKYITALAEHFNTTTDYILTGIKEQPNAGSVELLKFYSLSNSNRKAILNLMDNLLDSQLQS